MSWLDKIMNGHGKRADVAKETALTDYTDKLKALVYDEDIVKELAPIFAALHGTKGFDKVVELLETKEQQIAAISGGEWFKQQSDDQHKDGNQNKDESDSSEGKKTLTADEILSNKYKEIK